MSGLVCPHCAQEIALFKKGGGRELAEKYGLPLLGEIPLDPATVVASDLGTPVVYLEGPSPAKDALLALARTIATAAQDSLEAVASAHV